MEIRHIVTFQMIVKTGSYTEAAAMLGYTQSTITSHVQALERAIGGTIFLYTHKQLQLTSLGEELIPLAEDLLATHKRITQMQSSKEVEGVLKVAAPESLTISRLGPIIQAYSRKYPQVEFVLINGTCSKNQTDLLSGRVDIAFMVYPAVHMERCEHYSLGQEPIVLIGAPDGPTHFDAYKHGEHERFFITNEQGCSYRTLFERYMVTHQLPAFSPMELWSIEAIKQMVQRGLGFSFLPLATVETDIHQGRLRLLEHTETFDPLYSHMLVKKKQWRSPAVSAFADLISTHIPVSLEGVL